MKILDATAGEKGIWYQKNLPFVTFMDKRKGTFISYYSPKNKRYYDVNPDIVGDWTKKTPFPDNHFDIVYSNSMIEFIDEDKIEEVIKEMWRILKKDGKLVIGVLNKESTWAYKRKAESLEKESIFTESKFYTWEELESLLSKYGNAEMESTLFVPPYFEKAEDFGWFKSLEDEFAARFPKRGALLVGSVEKKEDFDG